MLSLPEFLDALFAQTILDFFSGNKMKDFFGQGTQEVSFENRVSNRYAIES